MLQDLRSRYFFGLPALARGYIWARFFPFSSALFPTTLLPLCTACCPTAELERAVVVDPINVGPTPTPTPLQIVDSDRLRLRLRSPGHWGRGVPTQVYLSCTFRLLFIELCYSVSLAGCNCFSKLIKNRFPRLCRAFRSATSDVDLGLGT